MLPFLYKAPSWEVKLIRRWRDPATCGEVHDLRQLKFKVSSKPFEPLLMVIFDIAMNRKAGTVQSHLMRQRTALGPEGACAQ